MKKYLYLLSMVLLLGACIPKNWSSSPAFEQVEGRVSIGEQAYPMIVEQLEWKDKNIEVSKISESDIFVLAEDFPTLEVSKEEKLTLNIDESPSSIKVTQYNEDGTSKEVSIIDNQIQVPIEEGHYIFEVQATWSQGEYIFIFDLEKN